MIAHILVVREADITEDDLALKLRRDYNMAPTQCPRKPIALKIKDFRREGLIRDVAHILGTACNCSSGEPDNTPAINSNNVNSLAEPHQGISICLQRVTAEGKLQIMQMSFQQQLPEGWHSLHTCWGLALYFLARSNGSFKELNDLKQAQLQQQQQSHEYALLHKPKS